MTPADIMHKIKDFYFEKGGEYPNYILLPEDPIFQHNLKLEFLKCWPGACPELIDKGFFIFMFGIPVLEYTGKTIELVH